MWALRSGAGRCKCLAPARVPEQRGLPAAMTAAAPPVLQPDFHGAADEVVPLGDPFALSVPTARQQRPSGLGVSIDDVSAQATAASLRRAASEEGQREAVRTGTNAAMVALHGIAAALLTRLEGAATEAAEAASPADAQPGIADILPVSNSSRDAPLLRECVNFKLTGMSQTTRSGTEAPVPPIGALPGIVNAVTDCHWMGV